jgi:DNA polymerase-3 subunit epsilon
MFSWFDKNKRMIKSGLTSSQEGPFRDYLMAGLPDINKSVSETEFLVIDFETTGLDSQEDHIISVGYTVIKNNKIILGASDHHIVNSDNVLTSENVSIHHLTDDIVNQGQSITGIIEHLLELMSGKVLVAHYQKIEYGFLQQVCQSLYSAGLPMILLDTLLIEKRKLDKTHQPIVANQLRLFNLRETYNLPRYKAHNAMEDAIATAELFLAQLKSINANFDEIRIKELI